MSILENRIPPNSDVISASDYIPGMPGKVVIMRDFYDEASRELIREDSESEYWRIHE